MFYVNQKNYPHVLYPTLTDIPEYASYTTTVSDSGCGLCAASMVVTNMTKTPFPLIDCLELSLAVNANHSPGTNMDRLAPYVAERFDLDLVMTGDPELLREHLKQGYMAVATATGDRPEEDWIGVFSHGGHYIAVVGIDEDGEGITVLDPSQTADKYLEVGRHDKVVVNGNYIHTTMAVLATDCKFRPAENYPEGGFKAWLEFRGDTLTKNRYYLFGIKNQNVAGE